MKRLQDQGTQSRRAICPLCQPGFLRRARVVQSSHECRLENGACLGMKNIGKPCAGKPHARFDEGGQEKRTMAKLMRHRRTKGAETDRPCLRNVESCSLLYPLFRLVVQDYL